MIRGGMTGSSKLQSVHHVSMYRGSYFAAVPLLLGSETLPLDCHNIKFYNDYDHGTLNHLHHEPPCAYLVENLHKSSFDEEIQ